MFIAIRTGKLSASAQAEFERRVAALNIGMKEVAAQLALRGEAAACDAWLRLGLPPIEGSARPEPGDLRDILEGFATTDVEIHPDSGFFPN